MTSDPFARSTPAPGPSRSLPASDEVRRRLHALTDPAALHQTRADAVKANAFASYSGHATGMSSLQTRLHVEAWVRNASYAKAVWVDVHVLDRDATAAARETLPLRYAHAAGDGGDLFVCDALVYQGSVATQGSVEPRPDARAVEYRLYCELGGQVFTDDLVHRCELLSDASGGVGGHPA